MRGTKISDSWIYDRRPGHGFRYKLKQREITGVKLLILDFNGSEFNKQFSVGWLVGWFSFFLKRVEKN